MCMGRLKKAYKVFFSLHVKCKGRVRTICLPSRSVAICEDNANILAREGIVDCSSSGKSSYYIIEYRGRRDYIIIVKTG